MRAPVPSPRHLTLLLLLWLAASGSAQRSRPVATALTTNVQVSYAEDASNFPNPERGFYRQDAPMWLGTVRTGLAWHDYAAYRAEGITVMRAYYVIDEFVDAALSAQTLTDLEADFAAIRAAGFKVIPRFAYNFPQAWPQVPPDAPLGRVLQHIDQLTPVLQANADVIAFVETGFVGAWGEWHDSTNGLVNADTGTNANSAAIVDALLDAVPQRRSLAIRYPHQKRSLFGESPLSAGEAFSGSGRARMGQYNDCFLANEHDGATYLRPPNFTPDIETLKNYLNQDNRYVPQGGETCSAAPEAQPYIACSNALIDFARMRWSTINLLWDPAVIAHWQSEGCFGEIQRRLGYRLRLVSSDMPAEVRQGRMLSVAFTVTNSGFAAPFNPRDVELVLRDLQSAAVHRLPLTIDPRFWGAGETHNVATTVNLPSTITPGTYQVLLNLPDPEPALNTRPEYSIRLANSGTWEAATGFNALLRTLAVTVPPPFTDSTLVPGVTPVRAVHISELRERINALRGTYGLTPATWTDEALVGVTVKRTHVEELRAALAGVYSAAGLSAPAYADSTVVSGVTPVRAVHVVELRTAVLALE